MYPFQNKFYFHFFLLLGIFVFPITLFGEDDEEEISETTPGIIAEYQDANGKIFRRIDERVSYRWGESTPDPRMTEGSFEGTWKGLLQTSASGDYLFHFYIEGSVELFINEKPILSKTTSQPEWISSSPLELSWGEQKVEVRYKKTSKNAQIAFFWEGPDFELEPVAAHWLTYPTDQSPSNDFNRGKLLVRALRCSACHQLSMNEIPINAPDLNHLNGNIKKSWMIDWLTQKPTWEPEDDDKLISRRMPHFALTEEEAEAVTSYLMNQSTPTEKNQKRRKKKSPKKRLKKGITSFSFGDVSPVIVLMNLEQVDYLAEET